MYKHLFFIAVVLLSVVVVSVTTRVKAEDYQVFHSNPLCDDYVRTKLDAYLKTSAAVNFDEYVDYKKQLINYCDQAIRCDSDGKNGNAGGQSQKPTGGLRSYKLNLY